MFAAKNDPEVRKRTGISKGTAEKFTEHDEGGKLPRHVGVLSKKRQKRRKK